MKRNFIYFLLYIVTIGVAGLVSQFEPPWMWMHFVSATTGVIAFRLADELSKP